MKPFYQQVGKGPDLVLLHGWGIHGGVFNHLLDDLSKHFCVMNIDIPGFGRSPLPTQDYTIDMITEQVLSVAPKNAHYLGWSMGGLIATHLAIAHPERVNKLVTVASNPLFITDDDWPHAMKSNVMDNFMQLLEEDYEGTLIRFLAIQTMGSEQQKEDIKVFKEQVFMHGQPAKKALSGGLEILRSTDLRDDLSKLNKETLRIYGRLDGLVPVKASEKIAHLMPNSREMIFRKASHAPFLSHADEFIEVISDFLLGRKYSKPELSDIS